jgi:hypothetical protein
LSGSHVAPVRMLILIHDSPHAEAGNLAAGTFFYRTIVLSTVAAASGGINRKPSLTPFSLNDRIRTSKE